MEEQTEATGTEDEKSLLEAKSTIEKDNKRRVDEFNRRLAELKSELKVEQVLVPENENQLLITLLEAYQKIKIKIESKAQ